MAVGYTLLPLGLGSARIFKHFRIHWADGVLGRWCSDTPESHMPHWLQQDGGRGSWCP